MFSLASAGPGNVTSGLSSCGKSEWQIRVEVYSTAEKKNLNKGAKCGEEIISGWAASRGLSTQVGNRQLIPGDKLHTVSCERGQTSAKKTKHRFSFFFFSKITSLLLEVFTGFMRACLWLSGHRNICEALCPVPAHGGGRKLALYLVTDSAPHRFVPIPLNSIYPQCKHSGMWMISILHGWLYCLNTLVTRSIKGRGEHVHRLRTLFSQLCFSLQKL